MRKKALVTADLRAMAAALSPSKPLNVRDRALLLLGGDQAQPHDRSQGWGQ